MKADSQSALEIGLQTQLVKQTVKTGLSVALGWIPIIKAIPFGDCIKVVGYKGAEKASKSRIKAGGIEGEALKDYKHTKAFLLYAGLTSTNESLYQRWVRISIIVPKYGLKHFILILLLEGTFSSEN